MNKIYIITDMEGISGVVMHEQLTRGTPEYEEARHLLAADVNAAVAGAVEAGCTEIVVNDSHSSEFNFLLEEMDPRADYITGSHRRDRLFGLDGSYDAVLLVGYHARAGAQNAVCDHTQSWDDWARFTVNGMELGEIGQEAAIAGNFGVPVAFVSGDRAAVDEARELLGDELEVVSVKEGHTRTSARCIHPVRARDMIRIGVARAVSHPRSRYRPFVLAPPLHVMLETTSTAYADKLEKNGWVRVDGRTVRKTVQSALEML